jgi:hypothetical protein
LIVAEEPTREFGKRRPPPREPPQPPVKRSGHVALLVMGSLAVGGGAYALMPRQGCEPRGPGVAAPALPNDAAQCPPRGASGGGSHAGSGGWWSSRSSFFGGDAATTRTSSGSASDSGAGGVTRGGFGSFARAVSMHFSGS